MPAENKPSGEREQVLKPCDCVCCPECDGSGSYPQQINSDEVEQMQCQACNLTGRVRPPESNSEGLVPLDENLGLSLTAFLMKLKNKKGAFLVDDPDVVSQAICSTFGTPPAAVVRWPEKKIPHDSRLNMPREEEAWNAAIDACTAAYASAQPVRVEDVHAAMLIFIANYKAENNDAYPSTDKIAEAIVCHVNGGKE